MRTTNFPSVAWIGSFGGRHLRKFPPIPKPKSALYGIPTSGFPPASDSIEPLLTLRGEYPTEC